MASNTAVFMHSSRLEQFSYPDDNPFKTQRAAMTYRILDSMKLLSGPNCCVMEPMPLTHRVVETFHTGRYLDVLRRAEEGHLDEEGLHMGLGTPECPVFKGMVNCALLAGGGTIAAADLIVSGQATVVFNPAGGFHHAGPERASGFCYINDVALACLQLARQGKRVVFLDIDVHHGDGVQEAFYERNDVMTISLHESGEVLFPGTGAVDDIGVGEGFGYSVNVPFPPDTYDEIYLEAFREVVVPLIGSFDPDVIVFEVGMDGLAGDPLAHLRLTNRAYADIAKLVLRFGKPVLATGGGGYHPENTARGWALVWTVLCEEEQFDDLNAGMGGVMLESTDWLGGLRDRELVPDARQRRRVEPAVKAMIEAAKARLFTVHGI